MTGGTLVTRLCRPGTVNPFRTVGLLARNDGSSPFVKVSIALLTTTSPQVSTKITSSMYGSHATITWPVEWPWAVAVTGLSPSRRKMVRGFQNFNTSTMAPMQLSELRMSVSSGPM